VLVLTCAECGRHSDENAAGWKAHLGVDDIDEGGEDEEPNRLRSRRWWSAPPAVSTSA
jgi:hypothetical protein